MRCLAALSRISEITSFHGRNDGAGGHEKTTMTVASLGVEKRGESEKIQGRPNTDPRSQISISPCSRAEKSVFPRPGDGYASMKKCDNPVTIDDHLRNKWDSIGYSITSHCRTIVLGPFNLKYITTYISRPFISDDAFLSIVVNGNDISHYTSNWPTLIFARDSLQYTI